MALDTQHPALGLDGPLSLSDACDIAEGRRGLALSDSARARCDAAHDRLQRAIGDRRHIYGITTGFGPLANRLIDPAHGVMLQQNLVHHLATGLGPALPWDVARAVVLARLVSIAQGYSGASPASIAALLAVLGSDLAPALPERGTVGASGDLTPLAHMVLALQGRGAFVTPDGGQIAGPEGLARLGFAPLDLAQRDGLALVNGTSAMTGIALMNTRLATRLTGWALRLTAALAETLAARSEAWSPLLAQLRPHPGQMAATEALNAATAGSQRLTDTPIAARRLPQDGFVTEAIIGQDAYTLRCAPQVIGAVMDAARWHEQVVAVELNAVSDNPVFPLDGPAACHGGNFMGQHVALASDALANAVTVLAGLAERQIARLTDERLNGDLPAFLHRGAAGLNSGLMGAQVTATATLAEMRSAGPVSAQSISTNGANQDVVSMGTTAARFARRACLQGFDILAILAIAVAQAVDIRADAAGCPPDAAGFSPGAVDLHRRVRALSAALETDRPLSDEITALSQWLAATDPTLTGGATAGTPEAA